MDSIGRHLSLSHHPYGAYRLSFALWKAMAMKKNPERDEGQELEILKAVAQAWHAHSGSIEPSKECDAYRSSFKSRPTRFKLEAMNRLGSGNKREEVGGNWDFGQSLWDSYEIVTLSKKLEAGLVLDNLDWDHGSQKWRSQVGKKRKESKNSLRNLFTQMSSKRFNVQVPKGDDIQL